MECGAYICHALSRMVFMCFFIASSVLRPTYSWKRSFVGVGRWVRVGWYHWTVLDVWAEGWSVGVSMVMDGCGCGCGWDIEKWLRG